MEWNIIFTELMSASEHRFWINSDVMPTLNEENTGR